MDLKDFYRLILRNLPIVTIFTLIGVITSAGITYFITPKYEAQIRLFVSTPSSALDISALVQGSSFSQQRVKSYAQIINSQVTLEPVINRLNLDTSVEKLSMRVKASAPLDTVLINVTVTDESPALAATIANAIGEEFSQIANQIEVTQAGSGNPIKVTMVKSAIPPKTPASPKVQLNLLLGLLLGFGLGVGVAILRQIFDNTIKSENDLGETPLLGVVGFDEEAEAKPLITQISRNAARTEAFRQLRTNLQYLRADNPPKRVGVTSALPGEGKTLTSINLALSLAQTGFKVVLVEADMRRPKSAKYLDISSKAPGLSELLSGKYEGKLLTNIQTITQQFGEQGELSVITSGAIPPNPSELLDSQTFGEILDDLSQRFEFVIVDCPPALPVADAAIISRRLDGVITVVEAGVERRNQFLGVREAIAAVGGQLLGVVLNKIPVSRNYDDYGYRYGYGYGYRGRYGARGYSGYKAYKPYASESNEEQKSS